MTRANGRTHRYCSICHQRHAPKANPSCLAKLASEKTMTTSKRSCSKVNRKRKHSETVTTSDMDYTFKNKTKKETSKKVVIPKQCPICLEDRGHQHTLGCGHGLCKECYSTLVKSNKSARCPMCRADMFRSKACDYRISNVRHRTWSLTNENAEVEDLPNLTWDWDSESESELEWDSHYVGDDPEHVVASEELLLLEAADALDGWKRLGGETITREMEYKAFSIISEDPRLIRQVRNNQTKVNQEQAVLVVQLSELYDNMSYWGMTYPPENPYSESGSIIGKMRLAFGYSTWVTSL